LRSKLPAEADSPAAASARAFRIHIKARVALINPTAAASWLSPAQGRRAEAVVPTGGMGHRGDRGVYSANFDAVMSVGDMPERVIWRCAAIGSAPAR
jgi:hypothetical protein